MTFQSPVKGLLQRLQEHIGQDEAPQTDKQLGTMITMLRVILKQTRRVRPAAKRSRI